MSGLRSKKAGIVYMIIGFLLTIQWVAGWVSEGTPALDIAGYVQLGGRIAFIAVGRIIYDKAKKSQT